MEGKVNFSSRLKQFEFLMAWPDWTRPLVLR